MDVCNTERHRQTEKQTHKDGKVRDFARLIQPEFN